MGKLSVFEKNLADFACLYDKRVLPITVKSLLRDKGVAREVRPKSAIAEISTKRTHHNHLTANLATTTGSRGG